MTKPALMTAALFLVWGLAFCTREDGLPDPPFQPLVPCNTDAGADDPLACPPRADAGVAALTIGVKKHREPLPPARKEATLPPRRV